MKTLSRLLVSGMFFITPFLPQSAYAEDAEERFSGYIFGKPLYHARIEEKKDLDILRTRIYIQKARMYLDLFDRQFSFITEIRCEDLKNFAGIFWPDNNSISLNDGADDETLVHELGHARTEYLRETGRLEEFQRKWNKTTNSHYRFD